MHNIDILVTTEEEIEDVFCLSELDNQEELEESNLSTTKIIRGAKEGINSVRLSRNDQDILEFMKDKGAFSSYVKKLIRAEINKTTSSDCSEIKELKELNDKMNEVLSLLQNGNQNFSINNTNTTPSPEVEDGEVFGNPDAHQFSKRALEGVNGILNRRV